MDDCDLASADELFFHQRAMEKIRAARSQGESMKNCVECGAPIPEKRRKYIPGCTRCVHCQTEFEKEGM